MNNTMKKLEAKHLEKLRAAKEIPTFGPGDTLKVNVKVIEGTRERIQAYEGVCIGRAGSGLAENFTVRKISYGEGVERVFPLWSPRIAGIEVVRRGSVRRAKLYYLRDLRGKSARITERTSGVDMEGGEYMPEETAAENTAATTAAAPKAKRSGKKTKADKEASKAANKAKKKA